VLFDQYAANRSKGIAIMRIVTDAQQRTVIEPHARGTHNQHGQGNGSAAQPADFEMLPVKRAIFGLAPPWKI